MKHRLLHVFGFVVAAFLGLAAGPAYPDSVGPYYATPSWDQTLPASTRFIVLTNMNSDAVLDRETGLVWEQSPSTSTLDWVDASTYCVQLSTGGRKGWRLPTIQDLASLIDPTVPPPGPTLPSGHPFGNVSTSHAYWSATTFAFNVANAWYVFFGNGNVLNRDMSSLNVLAWCVRGGPGVDAQ